MIKIAVSFTMRTIKPTSPISVDAVYAFPLCFFYPFFVKCPISVSYLLLWNRSKDRFICALSCFLYLIMRFVFCGSN